MRTAGVGAAPGEGLRRSCGHRLPAPARGWRRGETALRNGKRGDGHEVSILIRVCDDERAGRAFESFDDDHPAAARTPVSSPSTNGAGDQRDRRGLHGVTLRWLRETGQPARRGTRCLRRIPLSSPSVIVMIHLVLKPFLKSGLMLGCRYVRIHGCLS